MDSGTVTLLFTDLAGSTELLSRLGDDAAERLWQQYFGMLRDAAGSHGGREIKSLGDGVMLTFPSAQTGCASAVEMQRRIARHNERHPELALGVRIGLNVGDAIVEEDDYFGTAVVIAKRLCDRAEPGSILVSESARALVGQVAPAYPFRALGALSLKGLADPLPAWVLEWEHAPRATAPEAPARPQGRRDGERIPLPPQLAARGESPLVGRTESLRRMQALFDETVAGHGRVVLIAGEPGIGKTRLAAEVARTAHQQGAVVLYGGCDQEGVLPFQPFIEALRHAFAHAPAETVRALARSGAGELVRLLPELRRRLPTFPEAGSRDAETERFRLFEAARSVLERTAQDAPVVLVVDDVHWADKPTLLLLAHVARSAATARMLVLATYRDVELTRSHPLAETIAELRRERLAERLPLEGLSRDEVGELIAAWARQDPPAGLAEEIWRETEGHPLFVHELLRHLLETGAIREHAGRLQAPGSLAKLGVPEGVRELIARRLSRLDDDTYRLLAIAAVIGHEFSVEPLEAVADVTGDRLFELLEQAEAAGVIREQSTGAGYAFSHALIRGALYDALSRPRRSRLHLRIAGAIEQLGGASPALVPELAHHFFEAASSSHALDKAVEYAEAAGRAARDQLAYEDAATHFERAVNALTLQDRSPERRCELLLALGESRWSSGDFRRAREAFWAAAELAERLVLPERLAEAALGFGGKVGFQSAIRDDALIDILERALAQLPPHDSPLRARVTARLAEARWSSGWPERRRELAHSAIAMARRIRDPAVLAQVLTHAHWGAWADDLEARLAMVGEAERLADETGSTALAIESRFFRLANLFERPDIAGVDAALAQIERDAAALRQPYYRWYALIAAVLRAFVDEPLDVAERLAWEAVRAQDWTQNPSGIEVFGVQMFYIRRVQGRAGELVPGIDYFVDEFGVVPAFRCARALINCELGRLREAREELDALAVGDFAPLSGDMFWVTCLDYLTDICAHLGDQDRARKVYDQLLPFADRFPVAGVVCFPLGSAHRALGVAAATYGDFATAERHFAAAIEANQRAGMKQSVVHSQRAFAEMLAVRDAPGDRDRTRALAEQARPEAERLGLASVAARLRRLARDAAGPAAVGAGAREPRRTFGTWARAARDDTKAAISLRGRAALAKLYGDASDVQLERRFGSPLAQRALFTAMARAYQPRAAFGFEGEMMFVLDPTDEAASPSWWTVHVTPSRAVAGWWAVRRRARPAELRVRAVPVAAGRALHGLRA